MHPMKFAVAASLAVLSIPVARAQTAVVDAGAREWNQARGGPSLDSSNDVEPITSAPVEAWSMKFDAVATDPVVWGSKVYVVGQRGREKQLYALDLATGKSSTASMRVDCDSRAYLSVWQGFVALTTNTAIRVFTHRNDHFALGHKTVEGNFTAPPSVVDGMLFAVTSGGALMVVDMQTGESVAVHNGPCATNGQPAVFSGSKAGEWRVVVPGTGSVSGYEGLFLLMPEFLVDGLHTKTANVKDGELLRFGNVIDSHNAEHFAFASQLAAGASGEAPSWFVFTPMEIRSASGTECHGAVYPRSVCPLATAPVILGPTAIGFGVDGALLRFQSDGKYARVVPAETKLPTGARRGTATRARGVVYLDNWAVELESGRVLWCVPDLDPVSPLLPVADSTVLYVTKNGTLVSAVDPKLAAKTKVADPKSSAKKSAASRAAVATAPGSGDGVVANDGTRFAGEVTKLDDGRVRVDLAGTPHEIAKSDIALIESGSTVECVGKEDGVVRAFRAALAPKHVRTLLAVFDKDLEFAFLDECRRIVDEAKLFGLEDARTAELAKKLDGRTQNRNANADAQRATVLRDEQKQREKDATEWLAAADWARDHGLPNVSSVLLAWTARVARDPSSARLRALALVPKGFQSPTTDDAPQRWLELSEALVPVGGNVIDPDDAVWTRTRGTIWAVDTLAVRTPNFLWFTHEPDAQVVGKCLAHAERAVTMLERLLDVAPIEVHDDAQRLEVRLHKSRDAYLKELDDAQLTGMEWSAGYYSPIQNISRFYVPWADAAAGPLDRSLFKVLVHELTHHFIESRWLKRETTRSTRKPGYWVIEGVAGFVEDQVVEMERNGERWNDTTVLSLDVTARIAAESQLIPISRFVGLTHEQFVKLLDQPIATVQLRNTLGRIGVTERQLFYTEGAALVYFLMNHADAAKRPAFIGYLKSVYVGGAEKEGWTALGWSTPEALQAEFEGFLKSL